MTNGASLALALTLGLLGWLLADLIEWLLGRETMSQWVIRRSYQSKRFAWTVVFIMAAAFIVLFQHWELWGALVG